MTWTVRLRAHANGRIVENATFEAPDAAMIAYRALLNRDDLVGKPLAAVFKPPHGVDPSGNVATLFSRFDMPIGYGRIAADDPRLDPFITKLAGDDLTMSAPPEAPNVNWEADPRKFAECLRDWNASLPGGQTGAARELRVPLTVYTRWCEGHTTKVEGAIRRLMTLIDKCA